MFESLVCRWIAWPMTTRAMVANRALSQNGTRLQGRAAVRTGVPAGVAFLAEGIAADSANLLTEDEIEVRKP